MGSDLGLKSTTVAAVFQGGWQRARTEASAHDYIHMIPGRHVDSQSQKGVQRGSGSEVWVFLGQSPAWGPLVLTPPTQDILYASRAGNHCVQVNSLGPEITFQFRHPITSTMLFIGGASPHAHLWDQSATLFLLLKLPPPLPHSPPSKANLRKGNWLWMLESWIGMG